MGLNYRNILVVDDDSAMRALIARFIESGGYFVETAKDGFQALEMVENSSFDAVFLDLMMPNLSGLELLRRWNRTQLVKDLPILVITAKDDPKTVKQCLELGARDFIVKPPTRATVVEKLEKVLKRDTRRISVRVNLQQLTGLIKSFGLAQVVVQRDHQNHKNT